MAKVRRKTRAGSKPGLTRGRKPVFSEAQRTMIEKICLQVVRRETTQKGRPALTDRQRVAARRIVGDVVEDVLKQIGTIDARPPVRKRRGTRRK